MKRIVTSSLAVSLLVLPACKGGASADAVKLIPDEAEMVIGMSPKAITSSEVYKQFGEEIEKEQDFKDAMKAFEDCGVNPKEFDALVIGVKASSEDFVAVFVGAGVGKDDNASCAIKQIQKMNGDEEAADVTKDGGKKIIQFTDGRAYLVNDDMLAMATTAWQDKVGELIDGKGTPAIEGSKKDLYGKVDTKAAVWFFADVPAEMAGMAAMAAPEASKVKTVAGSVDLSKGVALDMVAGFGSEDDAKAVAEMAQKTLTDFKPMIPAGMSGMVESIKIEAAGTDVKMAASATMDDINAAKDLMK